MITADTNLAQLLDEHPGLVDFLAGYHEHFARLRDRMARRVMAPRVTLAQAAALAGVSVADLVTELRRAVGEPADEGSVTEAPSAPAAASPGPRPAQLDQLRIVEVDVRDDCRPEEGAMATEITVILKDQPGTLARLGRSWAEDG